MVNVITAVDSAGLVAVVSVDVAGVLRSSEDAEFDGSCILKECWFWKLLTVILLPCSAGVESW